VAGKLLVLNIHQESIGKKHLPVIDNRFFPLEVWFGLVYGI
jgi:hypothetical protein